MIKTGKYQIIEELGKGAMGIVYKARDPDINREVAIKTIRFDLVSEGTTRNEVMKRFIKEAQSAGRLTHPNIITIYDVGKEKDLTYIVMQYIEGQSLQGMIASGRKFTPQEIIQLMNQLCDALDYAHQHGIVHRDIKPANILLNKEGKPFVVDFGIARIETSTLTQSGTIIGTPSYMSPEQVMGRKVDNRSDIFSLGIILYELLTGKRPFDGENITTIIYKIVNEEPLPLVKVKKDAPAGFEHIIEKALAKDPTNRYQACSELKTDLHDLIQLTEKTMTISLGQEAFPAEKVREKRKLRILIPVALAGILLVVVAGALYFNFKPKQDSPPPEETQEVKLEVSSSLPSPPPEETQEVKLEVSSLPPQQKKVTPDPVEKKVMRVKESYEKQNFTETLKLAQELLSEFSDNKIAQEYMKKAQGKINETSIGQILASGISSYKRGDFRAALQAMERILSLDKEHKEAKQYLNLADTAILKAEIRSIIENQRRAEEEEDLLLLLNDIGSTALSNQRKADAVLLFNGYDDIKSAVSDISINFKNKNTAEVSFSHLLTGVYKKTGKRSVLFEGVKTWTMEKRKNDWKIMNTK